jgi:hypothetical protein
MMKRVLALVLLVLATGATGRAVVLCARLLCPQQAEMCCCCADQVEKALPAIANPMDCGDGSPTTSGPNVRTVEGTCCTVSSAPIRPTGEIQPRPSTKPERFGLETPTVISELISPESPPAISIHIYPGGLVCLDRSDTYLLSLSLRI